MSAASLTAAGVVRLLDLAPHPEGGHFRETFRDRVTDGGRAASTAIYFLLAHGERSPGIASTPSRSGTSTPALHCCWKPPRATAPRSRA